MLAISGLSRGFNTCCLRFKSGVAITHAKLASGWLARLYREELNPLDRYKRFQIIFSSPFSGFILALGRSASKIGSSTSIAAVMQTRSRRVEMPNGLSLPLAFGMSTLLMGSGR